MRVGLCCPGGELPNVGDGPELDARERCRRAELPVREVRRRLDDHLVPGRASSLPAIP